MKQSYAFLARAGIANSARIFSGGSQLVSPFNCKILSVLVLFVALAICPAASALNEGEPEPSATAAAVLDKYNRTGEFQSCLNLRRIAQIKPLDAQYFLIRANGGARYLNIVTRGCRGAARNRNRIQYTTSTGRLCRNEIINVIDNTSGIFAGSCGLGSFERLEKKEKPKADE
ncbi:MAG: hypothetical protein AAGL18_07015 [Pseudomonadota bacterium]